jgi:hypothetical protein
MQGLTELPGLVWASSVRPPFPGSVGTLGLWADEVMEFSTRSVEKTGKKMIWVWCDSWKMVRFPALGFWAVYLCVLLCLLLSELWTHCWPPGPHITTWSFPGDSWLAPTGCWVSPSTGNPSSPSHQFLGPPQRANYTTQEDPKTGLWWEARSKITGDTKFLLSTEA